MEISSIEKVHLIYFVGSAAVSVNAFCPTF